MLQDFFRVFKAPLALVFISTLFSFETMAQNLQLIIKGSDATETKIIDSLNYSRIHHDYNSVKKEIDSTHSFLLKQGYIESKLIDLSKTNDSIFTGIFHLKRHYETIIVYYDSSLINSSILHLVSNTVTPDYFILNIKNTSNALKIINSEIASKGFPFNKLKLSEIKIKNKNTLQANLTITSKDEKRHLDKTIIKGYSDFPKSFIKHYLKINPSNTFDLETLKRKTILLNNLRFANQIKPPEVLFTKDSTTLYLYIKKIKSNIFDGFLGFGNNETSNKLEFDGYVNLELVNVLNYGEEFKLLYKSDENDQKTFNTKATLPYLFKLPIGLDLELSLFKKDTSFSTVSQNLKLHYQLNPYNKTYVGISSVQSTDLLNEENNSIVDYSVNSYFIGYNYLKPQPYNLLFPTNTSVTLEFGIGQRKSDIENIQKQQNATFRLLKIINLNQKNSLYFKLDNKGLFSDSYFENELLRFGGINSIRGFEENSLLASFYSVLNSEYRLKLINELYVHTITDIAYFENNITKQKEKLFGFGFGFGILTKAGLLKFNYANGKIENQPFKLNNSKIHISLSTRF